MYNRITGIVYDILLLLANLIKFKKHNNKKALIIRVDEIGDYILWRKFLPELTSNLLLNGYEIHLCGNSSWKSLYNFEFNNLKIKTFWLDKTQFKKSIKYRFLFLNKLNKEGYHTVINTTFSRSKRVDDTIVKSANAIYTIGMERNEENYLQYEQAFDKKLYNKLFDIKNKPIFEFNRNKLFTEYVIKNTSLIENTTFDENLIPPNTIFNITDKYFVVFPGSRNKKRIWPTESFIEVSNYLYSQFGWTAVICGSKGDIEYANNFIAKYQHTLINIVDKTNLVNMLSVLKNAECLISVDTGSIHIASSVNCTTFGIFNGSQYGRFAPYPSDLNNNIYSIYPDNVDEDIAVKSICKYEFIVDIEYNTVKPGKVIMAIKKHYLL